MQNVNEKIVDGRLKMTGNSTKRGQIGYRMHDKPQLGRFEQLDNLHYTTHGVYFYSNGCLYCIAHQAM